MDKEYAIRSAAWVSGIGIFRIFPKFLDEPLKHLDILGVFIGALLRNDRPLESEDRELARLICETFANLLEAARLPNGVSPLAYIIEHLSRNIDDETWQRHLWLRLSKNRRAFIRRRFARQLRGGLLQSEADELWAVSCERADFEILRNIVLAVPSIHIPCEAIDEIAEMEGQGYLLSRTLAHILHEKGAEAFRLYRRRFPISTVYAAGFSQRKDLAPLIRPLLRKNRSEEDQKAAIWALARLGDEDTVIKFTRTILCDHGV